MEHAIIGTAGHVDHGKTALIKRLTGIDTDRLPEEQERELSIDLGFAYFDLPSGVRAGIVDVPGHERFVKNMLAGATGMDLVLLVIAADEGVMPQTREHRDILTLLGIRYGVIVLTKIDLSDPDWVDMVEDDVRSEMRGASFEAAPIVRVSASTGEGFPKLVETIDEVYAHVPPRDVSGPTRLWIDRVFSVRGFGTVVTGTLSRGRLAEDETVELLPQQSTMRVRAIQVHGEPVQAVSAAQRVALNLSRTESTAMVRGNLIAAPGAMQPTSMLDVRLRFLASARKVLANRTRVRLHIGTAEILARVVLLDCDTLLPGASCLAQLRLETVTAASARDHFVIRSYSPMTTIGGGEIIDPYPRTHRRYDERIIGHLLLAEEGSPRDVVEQALRDGGSTPITAAELARRMQREPTDIEAVLHELRDQGCARHLRTTDSYVHAEHYDELASKLLHALDEYHAHAPLKLSMPKSELQAAVAPVPAAILEEVIAHLREAGRIAIHRSGLRLADHEVRLTPQQEAASRRMEEQARRRGFGPPTRSEVLDIDRENAPALLALALDRGTLLDVGGFIFHKDSVERAKKLIRKHITDHGPMTVSQFRDLTESSRKFVVPLLEHLDRIRFTRRQGDVRVLVSRDEKSKCE